MFKAITLKNKNQWTKTYPLNDLGLTLIYTEFRTRHYTNQLSEFKNSRIWAKKSCISFLSLHYIVMEACLFPPKIGYVNQMTGCCMLFSWNFSLRRWCSIVLKVGLAALQTVLYYSVEVTKGTEV